MPREIARDRVFFQAKGDMQEIKAKTDEVMGALKGRAMTPVDDLVHRMDSPFSVNIITYPFLTKFRLPQLDTFDMKKAPLKA